MNESTYGSSAYDPPSSPAFGEEEPHQQPYAGGGGQYGSYASYPPPPAHQPEQPVTTPTGVTVWPGGAAGNGGVGGPGEPGAAAGGHGRKDRARRPIALFAAIAIGSGLIGGGTATLVANATRSQTTTTATKVINASSSISGVTAVAQAVSPSVVEINATSLSGESTGSGVVITSGGEIITNNHVISGASSIKVTFSDGKTATATVVGADKNKDLALVKAQNVSGLTPATLGNSNGVQVGDEVVAIGSPEGLTGTVTSGIVSALDRDVTVSTDESQGQQQQGGRGGWPFGFGGNQYNGNVGSSTTTYKAIQTDASLNPGNSGGALISMSGDIVGINSAMYSASSSSSGGSGSVGLGFAIPINTVKSDLATLRAGGSSN
jgi:putative serine protease PepD